MRTEILIFERDDGGYILPNHNPWKTNRVRPIAILNNTDVELHLRDFTADLLHDVNDDEISEVRIAPGEFWLGKDGKGRGEYKYDDGMPRVGTRTGTIDPN
ncbi:MAG TPA: hypothetical protein VJ984_14980 [Xanthomonadales bacterium]|nr:hypothetical protein [Xanthomonadales bacterium]